MPIALITVAARGLGANVSSGAGPHADRAFGLAARSGAAATYGISNAGLNALTITLAAELTSTAVMVNAVCPGLTATYPGAEAMGPDQLRKVQPVSSGRPPCPTTGPGVDSSATASR